MRYIPTAPQTLDALSRQAGKLKVQGQGHHTRMLMLVAAAAGYDDWEHVRRCSVAFSTFVGPMQRSIQPLVVEPMSIGRREDYSNSIAFPLVAGPGRGEQLEAAAAAGVEVSDDGNYVLFEGFPDFAPGALVAGDSAFFRD